MKVKIKSREQVKVKKVRPKVKSEYSTGIRLTHANAQNKLEAWHRTGGVCAVAADGGAGTFVGNVLVGKYRNE